MQVSQKRRAPSLDTLESIATALKVKPKELFNFDGKEFMALAEVSPEYLELWNLLRNKSKDQIRKIKAIAKILMS